MAVKMDGTQDASQEEAPIPLNFKAIYHIQNSLSNEEIRKGVFVNVIGFIKDFQLPKKTQGTDWKCCLEIIDPSIQHENHGMNVDVFWASEQHMPIVSEANSIVIIRNGKVQMRSGAVGLIANKFSTEFHIIPASKLLQNKACLAPDWQVFTLKTSPSPPTPAELAYVTWLKTRSDHLMLPSNADFNMKVAQSSNIREKFGLLKDVKAGEFRNILGEVVKIIDRGFDSLTVYLTDYTPNPNFYNKAWGEGADDAEGRDGDQFGYVKLKKKQADDWPGPYGKLCIQLTLFDGHAAFVRESVKPGVWVMLTNVAINFGKMGGLLEGFLRGDRHAFDGKIQVKILNMTEDLDEADPRWKDALRRKLEWWKKFNNQKAELLDQAGGLPSKRKCNDGDKAKDNSKRRRKERRAAAEKNAAANLNENVRCNFPEKPTILVKDILRPEKFVVTGEGYEVESPFTLRKYRANVRVVDYFPSRIEDFSIGRRSSDMDMLSDYSGGEDTDPEEDRRRWTSGKGFARDVWEWRFELLVEDASADGNKERLWLSVDNRTAQGLLGEDATSLQGNQELLVKVKEQLFKLWGDLEEKKSAKLERERAEAKAKGTPLSSYNSVISSPIAKAGAQPDTDSDVEDKKPKINTTKNPKQPLFAADDETARSLCKDGQHATEIAPKNKAFICCIRQYGIMVDEEDPGKANAGNGKRWQRKFGLFDTFIV